MGWARLGGLTAALCLLPVQAATADPGTGPFAALSDLGQALLTPSTATNAVVSPWATVAALGLVQAGAQGAAETEIEHFFGDARSGARAFRFDLPALQRQLQGAAGGPRPLAMAARMWVDQGAVAAVPGAYTQRLATRWQADAARVDFGHSEATRASINRWTAEHTAGRVSELLPAGSISAATRVALTTAVYFRSAWDRPFDPAQTVARNFRTASGERKLVPTMVDERGVLQARVVGLQVLEVPFEQGAFALVLVLPDTGAAPVFSGAQLARWRSLLEPIKCELALPRFAITAQSGSIKSALQALGVKTVFTDAVYLRPMLGRQAHAMRLDDLHHAAGITIDEAGGVAVAAAAATVRAKSLALPLPGCAVDRAFSFALVHRASGAAIFVGRVGDPARSD